MDLFVKEKLEKEKLDKVLKLLLKFLPRDNIMPRTQHTLFKYVVGLSPLPPETVHYYCKVCHFYVGKEYENCSLCGSECNKFFQLSIADQIKNLFVNHNLGDIISRYKVERHSYEGTEHTYSDISDGSEYKRAHVPGPFNLTLMGHTDGVSLTESSNVSLWPLEFVICELPPNLRFRFVLIAGVWLDTSKPYMNTYLKPFVEELVELFEQGITWVHPKTQEEHTSYVVAPVFCADAPVRAQLQNILSHGGKHCCNNCEQKMLKLPAEPILPGVQQNRRRRVFSFCENATQLRTAERMRAQGNSSCKMQERSRASKLIPKKGVRGKSILSKVPNCDRSTAVYAEYMHVLLGIIKQFMRLWFYVDGPWSLKEHQDNINSFLESVRVPDFVTRIPRSTECFSKWKSNELRSFLLYFSLVALSEVMKVEYFNHWMLLVSAVYLLLQDRITESDVGKADVMIRIFWRDFPELYRPEDFTYNMHNLGHFALTVKRWGNLWSNSAFMFESFNRMLTKYIHGSKNQGQELINTIQLNCGVQVLRGRFDMASSTEGRTNFVELRNEAKHYAFSDSEKTLLCATAEMTKPVSIFYRAVVNKEIFTSSIYTRQRKRNNFTVCYTNSTGDREYGEIKCFCESADRNVRMVFLSPFVVEHLRTFSHAESGMLLKHIIPIKSTDDVKLMPLQCILFKVIRVGQFVCIRPNPHEVNL